MVHLIFMLQLVYDRFIPKEIDDYFDAEFDFRSVANWKESTNLATAYFTMLATPNISVSGGGGSTGNDQKWGRDPREDEKEWAHRNYKIISEQVDASTAKVGKLLPMLKEANTVRVDESIKSRIEKVAVKMGDDVANAFGKKVRAVLDDVNEASGRISIPLDVALACMLTLLFTLLILVLVVIVNITEIHSGVLWIVLGGGFGAEILIYWLVWYLHRKGWV